MSSNPIGSYLWSDQCLKSEDYLISPNGIYTAILHGDGNICVYAGGNKAQNNYWGTGVSGKQGTYYACLHVDGNLCVYPDRPNEGTQVWESIRNGGSRGNYGKYCLVIHDDGNLCIYQGQPGGKSMWASNSSNPVKKLISISKIDYDIQNSIIDADRQIQLSQRCEHTNRTDLEQSFSVAYEKEISKMHAWEVGAGVSVSVGTELKIKYPIFAEGKISVSTTVSASYTHTEKEVEKKTYKDTVNVLAKAHSITSAYIELSETTIHVPYKLTGSAELSNGKIIKNYQESGLYTSNNAHNLKIVIDSEDIVNRRVTVTPIKKCIR